MWKDASDQHSLPVIQLFLYMFWSKIKRITIHDYGKDGGMYMHVESITNVNSKLLAE